VSLAHEIEPLIDDAYRRWRLPGVTCVVVNEDGACSIVRGLADIAECREVDARTFFRVASISKTFTGIAVMQLCEKGRLGLDDPVNDHLKAYRLSRDDVTIRHLLTHTAGIGELVRARDVFRPAALGMVRPRHPLPSLREIYGPVQRVAIAPGTKWAYANHGFATLGQLIEDVSGEPFAAYMRSRILSPLGVAGSFLRDADVDKQLATGYRFRRGRLAPVNFRDMTTPGAGGLICSTTDMGAYIAALVRGGPPLLEPASLETMLTPQYPRGEDLPAMGLAFSLRQIGSRLVAGHGGDLPGFKSVLRVVPGGVGVFVATNCNRSLDLGFALAMEGLADGIVARLLSVDEEISSTVRTKPPVPKDRLGVYRPSRGPLMNTHLWAMFGGEIEVIARDDELALRSPWGLLRTPVTLEPLGEDFRFKREHFVGRVSFERGIDGRRATLHLRTNVGLFTLHHRSHRPDVLHYVLRAFASISGLSAKGSDRFEP